MPAPTRWPRPGSRSTGGAVVRARTARPGNRCRHGRACGRHRDIPMEIERQGYRLASGRTRLMSRCRRIPAGRFRRRRGGRRARRVVDAVQARGHRAAFTFAAPSSNCQAGTRCSTTAVPGATSSRRWPRAWRGALTTWRDGWASTWSCSWTSRWWAEIDGEIAPLTRLDVNRAIPRPMRPPRWRDRRPRRTANGAAQLRSAALGI